MRGRVPVGAVVFVVIVAGLAAFVGVGLSKGWFNNDDFGDKVHPQGSIFSYTVPRHFTKGSFGGGQHSNYQGPPAGPDYSYVALVNRQWDLIAIDVVHGQSEAAGRALLTGIKAAAKADVRAKGGQATGFRLTRVAGRAAVEWTVRTYSQSGYKLGERKTYIQHGADAAIVNCQWRSDQKQGPRVAKGCDDLLRSFRFTS
jgi:hypothetical protein